MVFFTCTHCGESLKKPKVEKHFQFKCRNTISVSCMDCFKDFCGQEYAAHTKCISEAERYGGKDYVAKPGQNKGERKQQDWINVVHNVLASSTNLSNAEKNLLNTLSKHENIPRKKAKFLNFIKSVLGGRANMAVVESVWAKMEEAFKSTTEAQKSQDTGTNVDPKPVEADANGTELQENNVAENQNNENLSKENAPVQLGKKERKEKKKRDKYEAECRSAEKGIAADTLSDEDTGKKTKKSKKRRLSECVENNTDQPAAKKGTNVDPGNEAISLATAQQNGTKSKKSKKREEGRPMDENVQLEVNETLNGTNGKFDWGNTILQVVKSKGEVSLKKLRKKVLTEYQSYCKDNILPDKAMIRFSKKIHKMTEIVVNKEKVSLAE